MQSRPGAGEVTRGMNEAMEDTVVSAAGETRHRVGERLPPHPELPDLAPEVAELFRQVSRK